MYLKKFNIHRQVRLPRLDLEFLHSGNIRRSVGLWVLGIGILFSLTVGIHAYYTNVRIAAKLFEVNGYEKPQVVIGERSNPEELKSVQEAIAGLSLPWGSLFKALEGVVVKGVHLVSVEPESDKGLVKISAEATDVYSMLDYFRAFDGRPEMSDVQLEHYEVRVSEPDQPLRFMLSATWKPAP